MELLGTLGLYLVLAFVLPGFVYLLALGLCFPKAYTSIKGWLPPDANEQHVQGFSLFSFAVVLGLLLSSLTFAIEIALRFFCQRGFEQAFPHIDFAAKYDSGSYANVLIPSAIMHFNIGMGLIVFLLTYGFYGAYRTRRFFRREKGTWQFYRQLLLPRTLLILAMAVFSAANLLAASAVYHRVHELSPASVNVPPGKFPTSSMPGQDRTALAHRGVLSLVSVPTRSSKVVTMLPPLWRMKYST